MGKSTIGFAGVATFVAFVGACSTGGAGSFDGNELLSGVDQPGEGSEDHPGARAEDEAPEPGEDGTACPPCPVTCSFPSTVTVTSTSGDGGGQTQTANVSQSETFKEVPGGGCGAGGKDGKTVLALTCGGRIRSDLVPGGSIGTWTDIGGGAIEVCIDAKSALDTPQCVTCVPTPGRSEGENPPTGGGGTEFDAGSGGGRDAGTTTFDASGFDAGFSFDAGFGFD